MRIVWTETAVYDSGAARNDIARDNPKAADRQVERVLAAVAGLLHFAAIGRPGRRAATRALVINRTPYSAADRPRGDTIEFLRVMPGRQRWPDHL